MVICKMRVSLQRPQDVVSPVILPSKILYYYAKYQVYYNIYVCFRKKAIPLEFCQTNPVKKERTVTI